MRPGVAVVMTALLSECLVAGCATTGGVEALQSPPASALAITGAGTEPKILDLRTPGRVTIRYHLTHPAEVRIDLVNEEGIVARRLEAGRQSSGPQRLPWDGRTDDGIEVAGGVYRYLIHAQDAKGHQAVYDPSEATGGEELTPRDFVFDRTTGALRWVMPKAGRARLRIGLQGFPHLRTLLDWEPLEAGAQEVVWDGLDASGLIRALDHPQLSVKLSAFALPDHTIIVRGERSGGTAALAPSEPAAYRPEHKAESAYLHARHPRTVCHEARLSIAFPNGTRYDAWGRPILTGTVPVRVTLDARDAPSLVNQRFEVALYEDLTFLFEEEESVNPFTFLWDTTRLMPGEHLLTVNILSYDDHYGLLTQLVVIERGG